MSARSAKASKTKAPEDPQRGNIVPIQMTELSIFDDEFSFMKDRFAAEMRKMDEEMTKFSKDLVRLYGQTTTVATGVTSSQKDNPVGNWDTLISSPLVQGEGESKTLKLQFDVSQFAPNEIKVKIQNELLIVSAIHEEKTDNSTILREYNREFLLPMGTDPDSVVSSLSKDGVLTVQTPLPKPNVLEKSVSLGRQGSED